MGEPGESNSVMGDPGAQGPKGYIGMSVSPLFVQNHRLIQTISHKIKFAILHLMFRVWMALWEGKEKWG